MKINIFPFEKLEAQKAELRGKLNLPETVGLDLAFDVVHGVNDLCRSLADLHPHKRSIATLGPQPTPLRELISGFKGQGFVVQELPVSLEKFDEQQIKAAWEALKKDTLFVLTSALEPFTGTVYPFQWIRQEAPKKGIFTLIYQSPDSLERGLIVPETPFEGVVADPLWGSDLALVAILKGERCQGDRLLWGQPHFSDAALARLESDLVKARALQNASANNVVEDRDSVVKFEKKITAKIGETVKLIGPDCRRFYDRAVFFVTHAHGEALVHGLAKEGYQVFTAAACAWESPHLNPWLSKMGFAPDLIESSLVVPLKILKDPKFEDKLVSHIKELQKLAGQ